MLAALLIIIREGIEAFLIIGILLGYMTKMGKGDIKRYVWGGTLATLALSIVLALAAQTQAVQFEGTKADVFEVVVALVAVVVLTWMVLWMQRQAWTIRGEPEHEVATAISRNQVYALAGLGHAWRTRVWCCRATRWSGPEAAVTLSIETSGGP